MFKIYRLYILVFAIIVLVPFKLCAGQDYYSFESGSASGDWQKAVIAGRKVLVTDSAEAEGVIQIEVPEDGCYQLYVSLYHSWRKFFPFLFVEAVDSAGKEHSGYAFSEPRWYLPEGQGAWEIRCPSAFPFWKLSKGKMKIKFWLKAKDSCWERNDVLMESEVAIDKFMLVVIDGVNKTQSNPF